MSASSLSFIDLKRDYAEHKQEFDDAMVQVCANAAFILGPPVRELEEKLAQFVGVKHCITVANGTVALQIALLAVGVKPGDEVITVPFTWISTPHSVDLVGAVPVFVDIDPVTFNIDVTKIEAAITKRTKAIMAVSLFGQMPNYSAINDIAAKYGLVVIEDAAQSFGATWNGKSSCSVTKIACTSFYPAKPLGCFGEGGAVFTSDDEIAGRVRAIRTNGGEVRHNHTLIGYNARLETLQAAVLLVKLRYFADVLKKRAELGSMLSAALAGARCVSPSIAPGNTHTYAQYTIRVQASARAEVIEKLKQRGIPTAIYYPKCCHLQPCYNYLNRGAGSFPVAEKASAEVLSLPFHPYLSAEDIARIATAVREAVGSGVWPDNFASYVHPSAAIDADVAIGKDTKIWHFVHVSPGCRIGSRCNLGQNVFLGNGVVLGSNVRIQNNVSVYAGVEVDDDVFLGPSMVFTNDTWPRSGISKPVVKTVVQRGASIGANATIVCGTTIGKYALIGAGAVVTKDVPAFALMVGNPAKQIGWVSKHGEKLNLPLTSPNALTSSCPKTMESYILCENTLREA